MSNLTASNRPLIERLSTLNKQIDALAPHLDGSPDITKLTVLIHSEGMNSKDTALFFNSHTNSPVPESLKQWLETFLQFLQYQKLAVERELEKKLS